MEKPADADRPLLAFALALAAALCFAAMSSSVRALHGTVGTPEAVFFRGFAGGLLASSFTSSAACRSA